MFIDYDGRTACFIYIEFILSIANHYYYLFINHILGSKNGTLNIISDFDIPKN